ncbi:MAG: autotransporter outer membrane beta-barrel domain-containing protein [Planctomycetaceae bacterium]|jgi:hypothetical protein|nr:autotransporter outer membrane beta-barrel domain-containing protein [Planctomycetaceae bacterium]
MYPFNKSKTNNLSAGSVPTFLLGCLVFAVLAAGNYAGAQSMMSDNFLSAARIHSAYTMWNGTHDHLISGNTQWLPVTPQPFKFELPEKLPRLKIVRGQVDENAGLFGNPIERAAWINYVGRSDSFDNSYSSGADWKVKMDGWQAGFDLFRTSRNQLGLLLGFEKGDTISGENRLETDDHYIGLYAAHILNNGMDIRLLFNYGWQEFDSLRWNTVGNAASFTGTTSEFTLEFGKRLVQESGFSMRPVLAFDFYETKMDKGGEYDSTSPVSYTYSAADYKQTFFRTGGDFQFARDNLLLNCGLFWSTDLLNEKLATEITRSEVTQSDVTNILRGGSPSGSLVTFNLNGSYTFRQVPVTVFGGYTIHGSLDGDGNAQNIGHAGGMWRW